MTRLRATILGCGSSPGVPRIGNDWGACDPNEPKNRRLRCALLIERFNGGPEPTTVLVDTGPDVRTSFWRRTSGALTALSTRIRTPTIFTASTISAPSG